jgi:hypothetical protein
MIRRRLLDGRKKAYRKRERWSIYPFSALDGYLVDE